jgi:hypothetical protein
MSLDKENVSFQFPLDIINRPPQVNRPLATSKRKQWTTKTLEEVMDVIEKGTCSLRMASKSWTFFFYHLNKTWSRKVRPTCVFIDEKNIVIVVWTLAIQKCGLPITLQ